MEPLIIEEGSHYSSDNHLHVETIKELIEWARNLDLEPTVSYFESVLSSDYWTITTDFMELYEELIALRIEELIEQVYEVVELLDGVDSERIKSLCKEFTYEYMNELTEPMALEAFVKEVIDARHVISVHRYRWG